MRARFSDLPLRSAALTVALVLLAGCAAPAEEPEPAPSAEPTRGAPSNAVATAPEFTADSVSLQLEETLAEELGEEASTLAGESARAVLTDSDAMIRDSGVSPSECAPTAETQGLPDTGIAVGITSRTLEDGSAESRSVRIVRFDTAADLDSHLEGIRVEATDCATLTVDQGEGLSADISRTVEDLDPEPGLIITTDTTLTMEDEASTEGAEDAGDTESEAVTPSLELAPTTAVYVAAGTDLYVYTGDADTDTDAAVELIERLRERLES
ncbi:MAG: hypothetical protein ACTHZ5_03595 [Micrococcaceae bacterium]